MPYLPFPLPESEDSFFYACARLGWNDLAETGFDVSDEEELLASDEDEIPEDTQARLAGLAADYREAVVFWALESIFGATGDEEDRLAVRGFRVRDFFQHSIRTFNLD